MNPFMYRVQADMNPKVFHYLIHHYFDVIPEIIIKVLSLNKISKKCYLDVIFFILITAINRV
jgi:hypothetical protein